MVAASAAVTSTKYPWSVSHRIKFKISCSMICGLRLAPVKYLTAIIIEASSHASPCSSSHTPNGACEAKATGRSTNCSGIEVDGGVCLGESTGGGAGSDFGSGVLFGVLVAVCVVVAVSGKPKRFGETSSPILDTLHPDTISSNPIKYWNFIDFSIDRYDFLDNIPIVR